MKYLSIVPSVLVAAAFAFIPACAPLPGDPGSCTIAPDNSVSNSFYVSEGDVSYRSRGGMRLFTSGPEGESFILDNRSDADFFASNGRVMAVTIRIAPGVSTSDGQVLHLGTDFTIPFASSYMSDGPYDYPSRAGVDNPVGEMTLTIESATSWVLDGTACGAATSYQQAGTLRVGHLSLHR